MHACCREHEAQYLGWLVASHRHAQWRRAWFGFGLQSMHCGEGLYPVELILHGLIRHAAQHQAQCPLVIRWALPITAFWRQGGEK